MPGKYPANNSIMPNAAFGRLVSPAVPAAKHGGVLRVAGGSPHFVIARNAAQQAPSEVLDRPLTRQ